MPKQHARRLGWLKTVFAGVALAAVSTSGAIASSQPVAHPDKAAAHNATASKAATPAKAEQQAAAKSTKAAPRAACATDRDMAALNARVVQTELMVAALSCEERTRYNEFATSFQNVLVGRADDLRSFFQRTAGKQGSTRMNALVTRLANDASRESQNRADTYCQFASELFDEILKTPPVSFNAVVDKPWIAERHGVRSCNSTSASR